MRIPLPYNENPPNAVTLNFIDPWSTLHTNSESAIALGIPKSLFFGWEATCQKNDHLKYDLSENEQSTMLHNLSFWLTVADLLHQSGCPNIEITTGFLTGRDICPKVIKDITAGILSLLGFQYGPNMFKNNLFDSCLGLLACATRSLVWAPINAKNNMLAQLRFLLKQFIIFSIQFNFHQLPPTANCLFSIIGQLGTQIT